MVDNLLLYDPTDEKYFDSQDAKEERDKVFKQCSDCRLCVKYCYSFKSLFKFVDQIDEETGEQDDRDHDEKVDELTDAQHDQIVSECFQCKLCYVNCPYTPDQGQEWKIDFPRLMLRSLAIMNREGKVSKSAKLIANTDLQGKVFTSIAPLFNKTNEVKPVRKLIQKVTGISKDRLLPTYSKTRFSKWFKMRKSNLNNVDREVALFPTCLVEYNNPEIGHSAVRAYEKNNIKCSLPAGQVCCGMPHLDAGDTEKFVRNAKKNIKVLLPEVENGKPIVVAQPTCAYVLKKEYPDYLGTEEAQLVADNTYDVSEHLYNLHASSEEDFELNQQFNGELFSNIFWHQPCHAQAQEMGPKSMQLMRLTGAKVTMNNKCSAIDGTWGLRHENIEMSKKIAKPLMQNVNDSDADIIVGDCNFANMAIKEGTDKQPLHPIQIIDMAYGDEYE